MILVIPLLNNNNYEQLRFALRSITTHHDVTRCILVGGKPKWYTGEHIPHKDYGPIYKEHNIRDKVLNAADYIASETVEVGTQNSVAIDDTDFLFANDDHILLAPITKVYDKGSLLSCLSKRVGNGSYTRCLRNTYQRYGDVPDVDTHCPMMMNTELVKRTNFEWPPYGIGFKTCYAQENNIASETYPDCKTDHLPKDRRLWFSMTDNFPVKELFALFPKPSIFEQ